MGGIVLPPKRPRRPPPYTPLTIERDNFYMDFENAIFQTDYDQTEDIPKGPRRFENEKLAEAVKRNVYPHHSDVDWDEYCEWVKSGFGDELFQEREAAEICMFCNIHDPLRDNPLDVWYDCDACCQETEGGPKPQDCRYIWRPLTFINGQSETTTNLR